MEKNIALNNLPALLKKHKLTDRDYEQILKILDRHPNLVELGIFSAMWSEHCSYKSSRKYLSGFPTKAPWVIQGPGENAGIIDIGGGYGAVFKMESHNHPSYIEPYQGAATGVGGIMRDVFTMGARPIASLNSLRFGDVSRNDEVGKHHRYLLKGVVGGISGYGNSMGVPTIGGETSFEDCYNGNILVNAFNLGLVKNDEIFYGRAEGIGNPVIYVGSKTGRDGLGGAVMSSDGFNEESKKLRPTVQVGDPFTEKLLLEACLEVFKTDWIVGIQDMGAAGLTSSSFEMADRAGSGMKMNLSQVPARETGMLPYEFMLSESQERMLICAKKGFEDKVIEIFHKWELDAVVIGEVTDSGRMEIYWENNKIVDMPIKPIASECPIYDRPVQKPKYLETITNIPNLLTANINNSDAFIKLLSHVEVVDKSWIYEQYDSMVQTNTIKRGGDLDASVIRIKETGVALAMSTDCNPRFTYIDPKGGSASAVMESGRNVAMSGATPKAITDCLNFGNPLNPEVMWQFAESTYGIKEACSALATPVISGNVSLYNETNGVSVYPTPSIAMVGVNPDQNKVLPSIFQKEDNSVYIAGNTKSEFGGSLYLKAMFGLVAGKLPEIDFKREKALWDLAIIGNEKNILASAKDLNIGGLAIALAKSTIKSGLTVHTKIEFENSFDIFSESFSRAMFEVKTGDEVAFENLAQSLNIYVVKIGNLVTSNEFKLNDINFELNKLRDIYFNGFKRIIKKEE